MIQTDLKTRFWSASAKIECENEKQDLLKQEDSIREKKGGHARQEKLIMSCWDKEHKLRKALSPDINQHKTCSKNGWKKRDEL